MTMGNINKICKKLYNKKILIWGYGREGKSTEQFIQRYCSVKSMYVFEGKKDEINENDYDYIIKSPGIQAECLNEKYTSQTELFLAEFSSQIIGITGTKGKSTTASLLFKVLSDCLNTNVLLVGNIGLPCLDYYSSIDKNTVIVFEMSCHQLFNINFSPHVAVFLNLYEDHLDYYRTMDRYFKAKSNITLHQTEDDFFYVGDCVPKINTIAKKIIVPYHSLFTLEMQLKGEHNQYNAVIVYKICTEIFYCNDEQVMTSIKAFKGLAHRMEFISNINGVDYYDDSISTIPEATIQAIFSISNANTILIGGMDRHIHYDILIEFIRAHDEYYYILMYDSGLRIYNEVSDLPYCYYKEDLQTSVKLAKEITKQGMACILSPAAASYGYFENFEKRGEAYKQLLQCDK